jgi:hypothetical protein
MLNDIKLCSSLCLFLVMAFIFTTMIESSRPLIGEAPFRFPSSEDSPCGELLETLATEAESNAIARFVFQRTHFDENVFESEKDWFVRELSHLQTNDKSFSQILGDRPIQQETIVAFIEALRLTQRSSIELRPLTPALKRKALRLSQKLMSTQAPVFRETQEILSELFEHLYGSVPQRLFLRSDQKKEILSRAMMESLSYQGLHFILPHFHEASRSSLIAEFRQSRLGKITITGFLNLPVLMGLPPLYLPGLRRLQLPAPLALKALDQGLNDLSLRELEAGLNLRSGTLNNRARYEIFRRYYMVGVSGYLIMAMAYDSYQEHEALKLEKELLEELSFGVSELLSPLADLDERHPSCASLERCFEARSVNFESFEPRDSYIQCKELFDRRAQCLQYP